MTDVARRQSTVSFFDVPAGDAAERPLLLSLPSPLTRPCSGSSQSTQQERSERSRSSNIFDTITLDPPLVFFDLPPHAPCRVIQTSAPAFVPAQAALRASGFRVVLGECNVGTKQEDYWASLPSLTRDATAHLDVPISLGVLCFSASLRSSISRTCAAATC